MPRSVPGILPLLLLTALAACSPRTETVTAAAPVVPTPPVVAAPMPLPPKGSAPGLAMPARLPDGSYATPNRGVAEAGAMWHLRAGFNVAALTCTAQDLAPDYNRLLAQQRAPLAAAHKALSAQHGGAAPFDVAMTRLYNYFAQPPAQKGFCAAVGPLLREAAALPPGGLAAFAPGALAQLDRPFTEFFATYDRYRQDLALWRAGQASVASQAPRITVDSEGLAGESGAGAATQGAPLTR